MPAIARLTLTLAALAAWSPADDVTATRVEPPTGAEAEARQQLVRRAGRVPLDAFEAREFVGARGRAMPYRLLVPAGRRKHLPLVLFLHGKQGRGDDNRKNLRQAVSRLWALPGFQEEHECLALVPQCPSGLSWTRDEVLETVFELLDQVIDEFDVDRRRVYITGLSMGGAGTWAAIDREPGRFAAALIVCGASRITDAGRLVDLPIRVFHGDEDPVVDVGHSRRLVAALDRAGATDVAYTEYIGVGHDSWNLAYTEPGALDWLMAQHRRGR